MSVPLGKKIDFIYAYDNIMFFLYFSILRYEERLAQDQLSSEKLKQKHK